MTSRRIDIELSYDGVKKLAINQTWNLSKILHRRIFRLKILHRQFHLILTVLVRKNTKNEWKWRNLHRWQKFYTAAGTDGIDKFHLWLFYTNRNIILTDVLKYQRTPQIIVIWYQHMCQFYHSSNWGLQTSRWHILVTCLPTHNQGNFGSWRMFDYEWWCLALNISQIAPAVGKCLNIKHLDIPELEKILLWCQFSCREQFIYNLKD